MFMKRFFLLLTVMVLCCSCCLADAAETHGFGIINASQVAVRENPKGQKLYRVKKDQSVWINDVKMDSQNEAWYQVSTLADNGRPVTGWMKAEFIDAGDALWNDVQKVSIGYSGLIALKNDGTALVAPGYNWGETSRYFMDDTGKILTNCRDVMNARHQALFYALTNDNTLHPYPNRDSAPITEKYRVYNDREWAGVTEDGRFGSLAEGFTAEWIWPTEKPAAEQLRKVDKIVFTAYAYMLKTEDHQVFCCSHPLPEQVTIPDFSQLGEVKDLVATDTFPDKADYHDLDNNIVVVTAWTDMNGAVTVVPADAAPQADSWTDVVQLCITLDYLLGLKSDGTVVSTGLYGKKAPDLSGWTDISYIDSIDGASVGVKTDGNLIFDGSFDYKAYYTIK